MVTTNITNLRKDIFGMFEQAVKYNQPVAVSTRDGNAVIISEDDYRGLMETLSIMSTPGLKESIIEGMNTPLSECVPSDEVDW
jgi:PHD/YefM family antitoxin component YafN of YafNO toxin-antitoxin module